VRDCVGTIADAGCTTFIVHARNAILKGLSPKENREIPPLRYEFVYRLKKDFPDLEIILNGGVKTLEQIDLHLQQVDGVMIGREAYHNPWLMSVFDRRYYGDPGELPNRLQVLDAMQAYISGQLERHREHGLKLNGITRHMLGLVNGLPGARRFRQLLSDPVLLRGQDPALLRNAFDSLSGNSAFVAAPAG
jgi:tRNA-dihydrouridine synthase A